MTNSAVAGALTAPQKTALRDQGYVVLPGLVPRVRCEAALTAINASLGRGLRPEDVPRFRATSFCPELQKAAVIVDLFRETPASASAASLVGGDGLERVTTGQIALSFPTDTGTRPPHPHIDGLYTPDNGVPRVRAQLHHARGHGLATSHPGTQNPVARPGSHRVLEVYFRARTAPGECRTST